MMLGTSLILVSQEMMMLDGRWHCMLHWYEVKDHQGQSCIRVERRRMDCEWKRASYEDVVTKVTFGTSIKDQESFVYLLMSQHPIDLRAGLDVLHSRLHTRRQRPLHSLLKP